MTTIEAQPALDLDRDLWHVAWNVAAGLIWRITQDRHERLDDARACLAKRANEAALAAEAMFGIAWHLPESRSIQVKQVANRLRRLCAQARDPSMVYSRWPCGSSPKVKADLIRRARAVELAMDAMTEACTDTAADDAYTLSPEDEQEILQAWAADRAPEIPPGPGRKAAGSHPGLSAEDQAAAKELEENLQSIKRVLADPSTASGLRSHISGFLTDVVASADQCLRSIGYQRADCRHASPATVTK